MLQNIIQTTFSGIMPYLAPLIFIIGGVAVADRLRDLLVNAFNKSAYSSKRRGDY